MTNSQDQNPDISYDVMSDDSVYVTAMAELDVSTIGQLFLNAPAGTRVDHTALHKFMARDADYQAKYVEGLRSLITYVKTNDINCPTDRVALICKMMAETLRRQRDDNGTDVKYWINKAYTACKDAEKQLDQAFALEIELAIRHEEMWGVLHPEGKFAAMMAGHLNMAEVGITLADTLEDSEPKRAAGIRHQALLSRHRGKQMGVDLAIYEEQNPTAVKQALDYFEGWVSTVLDSPNLTPKDRILVLVDRVRAHQLTALHLGIEAPDDSQTINEIKTAIDDSADMRADFWWSYTLLAAFQAADFGDENEKILALKQLEETYKSGPAWSFEAHLMAAILQSSMNYNTEASTHIKRIRADDSYQGVASKLCDKVAQRATTGGGTD